jgi:hypothetical protein
MESFSFNLDDWRGVCIPPTPPAGTVVCAIDPCFGHREHSDETGISVGEIHQLEGESHEMILLDAVGVKRKGGLLADFIVDVLEKWRPEIISIEGIPAAHLLADAIVWRAELRGVSTGCIRVEKVDSTRRAKAKRIRQLHDYITSTPPRLRIHYSHFVDALFHQVELFTFEDDNKGRHDDILDSLAALMRHLPF